MAEGLNFSLPEPKKRGSLGNVLVVLLLLAVLVLAGVNMWLTLKGAPAEVTVDGSLSAEKLKELAGKLAARNLYEESARVWKQYLEAAPLSDEERARTLFRIGDMLLKAEKPQEAIEYFYRSEMVKELPDLTGQLNANVKEAFENAGRFAALRYELMDRTTYQPADNASNASAEVVAEIGPEKITQVDLERLVEEQIDAQLSQMASMMPPEQLNQQKERMLSQLASPQNKIQILSALMAEESLYREALAQKIDDDDRVKRQMRRVSRQYLAQLFLQQQIEDKIHITDSDMQTYYQANQSSYKEPAQALISHIQVATEDEAKKVIQRINDGEDFAQLASELSLDETSKNNGGELAPITKGRPIPGIDYSKELEDKIFSASDGAILDKPVPGQKGSHVILVRSIIPERQQTFQEVQDDIYQTLTTRKRQEAQQELVKSLMDKYNIVIHRDAIMKDTEKTKDNK
ncbi:MAG: peptidyl-prolyl cis-trans isomerase [Sedimentisphaerales bacterium]|nr:peptidyl-prolyl cis-trans isomerase [Sedimentisphaerales bacterium]